MQLAFSAGLCMLFCGNEGLDAERRALRHAMIVENLQQLYTDVFIDWSVANEGAAEELRWLACAIDKYLRTRMKGAHFGFDDAFAAFRDWQQRNPDESSSFVEGLGEETVS
jgi:hypothetical protein